MLVPAKAFARKVVPASQLLVSAVAAWLAVAMPANAQSARVYVANSSNSRVLQVLFNPNSASVVLDDPNLLTQVRDIAFRDDGLSGLSLIVCDRNGGRLAFYQGSTGSGQTIFDAAATTGPERPDGMSLDAAGNLFVMNSGQGGSGGLSQVWVIARDPGCPNPAQPECRPGGYRTPLGLIDPNVQIATVIGGAPALVEAELLPESLVRKSAAGMVVGGDLLVLTNPGALVRYRAVEIGAFLAGMAAGQTPATLTPDTIIHPANSSVAADRRFPAGAEPNGMAFGPSGELLIPVSDGRILIYGSDGRRRGNGSGGFVDFAAGVGQDEFKIATGLQDGRNRVFVTHQQRGEVRRYSIAADGTGILEAVVGGFQFPVGVDATNSNTVTAPAGSNVTVVPNEVFSSRIDRVVLPGLVNARVSTFPDPREAEQSIPAGQPLHRSLFLNELRADLPAVEIPAYARAFRLGDPNTGTPSFILVEADSNMAVAGVLDHLAIETPILGYDPDCNDPDITKQPFLFWAPDANDAPIVEGATFIDITTGCGSIRGMSRDMSYFLAGVRITAPMTQVVGQKLAGLRLVISGSPCINRQVARRLESLMDRADRDFARARYAAVAESLQAIDAQVSQSPQAFLSCTANTGGDIQARARSAVFVLSKLP